MEERQRQREEADREQADLQQQIDYNARLRERQAEARRKEAERQQAELDKDAEKKLKDFRSTMEEKRREAQRVGNYHAKEVYDAQGRPTKTDLEGNVIPKETDEQYEERVRKEARDKLQAERDKAQREQYAIQDAEADIAPKPLGVEERRRIEKERDEAKSTVRGELGVRYDEMARGSKDSGFMWFDSAEDKRNREAYQKRANEIYSGEAEPTEDEWGMVPPEVKSKIDEANGILAKDDEAKKFHGEHAEAKRLRALQKLAPKRYEAEMAKKRAMMTPEEREKALIAEKEAFTAEQEALEAKIGEFSGEIGQWDGRIAELEERNAALLGKGLVPRDAVSVPGADGSTKHYDAAIYGEIQELQRGREAKRGEWIERDERLRAEAEAVKQRADSLRKREAEILEVKRAKDEKELATMEQDQTLAPYVAEMRADKDLADWSMERVSERLGNDPQAMETARAAINARLAEREDERGKALNEEIELQGKRAEAGMAMMDALDDAEQRASELEGAAAAAIMAGGGSNAKAYDHAEAIRAEGEAKAMEIAKANGMDETEAKAALADARMATDWKGSDDKVRVLSTGRVLLNPDPEFLLDDDEVRDAIAGSSANPFRKKLALAELKSMQNAVASIAIEGLRKVTAFTNWADKHGKKYAGELGITTDVDLLRGFLNDASGYRQWNAKSQLIFKESFNQIGKDLAALGGMIHLGAANLVGAEGYKDQVLGRVGEISELNEDDAATYEGAHAALGTSKAQRLIQGGAVSLIPSLTGAGLAVSGTRTLLNGLARNVVKGIAAKATRGGLTKGALAVAEKNLAGIAKKAGARMGLDGAAVSAMAQETGGIFPRHYQMNLDRGMSPSDAANAAAGSAIVSGIGVAVATRAFGYRGTESIFGKTGSELLIKGGRDKLLQVMKDKGFRKLFAQVVKERVLDGLTEAPEEGLSQLWSGIVEKWTANPDKTWGEIWSEAFEGAWVGAVLGTGVPAVKSLSGIADYRKGRELRGKDLILAADVAVAREHVTNAPLPEGADPLSHEAGKEQVMASLRLMEKGVDALNQTELSALGLERKNGKVVEKALPKGEDGAAPVRTVMMEDGVPIVTDEGLAAIESISPEARRLFKLDEAEQRDKVRLNKILQETRAAEAKQATEAKQKEETTPATAATAETDPRFEPLVVRLVEAHGMDQATAEAEAGKALPRYGPNEDYTLIATDIAGDQLDTAATEKPATEPASDKPATWQPDRSAKLPRELAGAKPNYGKAKLGFDSDIDRALFITSQAKKSPRDADYRAWLREQGFTDGQIDSEGKKLRARVKGLAIGSMNTSGSVVFIPSSPEPTKAKQDEATKKPPQQTTEANPAADAPVHTQEATAGVSNTDTVPAPGQVEGTHEGQGQEAEIDPSEEADPDDIAETIAELEQSEPNPPLSEQEQAEEAENFQRQGKPDSYDNLDPVPTTVPKVIEGEGARVLREVIESENGERLANAGIEVDYVPDPGEGTSGVSVDADTGRIKVNLERFGKAFSGFGNKRKIARRVFDEELHHATTIKALLGKHKGDMTKVRAEVASAYKNFEKTQKKHADRLGNLYGGKRWGAMDDFRKGMEVIRMFHQMANGGFTTENVWRTGKENVEGRKAFDALLKERPPVTNAFRKILQAFIDFVSGNKDLSAVDDMVRLSKAADKLLKQSTPKESMARKMGKNMDRADTPVMNFLRENPVKAKNHHDNAKTLFRINIKRAKGDELSEKETQWLSDYDGQPSSKSFGKYGKGLFVRTGGSNPDQVAQQLADEGMIENGTAEALYQALERERTGKAMDAVNPMEKTDSRGDYPGERFARDTSDERKGSVRQVALGLDAGDIIKVNGERVEILENDNDFVTFQGGKKYGYGRVPVMLDLWIDKDSPSIQNNGGMSALFASAPDAQFKSLTADLPSKPSQEQLGAWRKANPEKYAELKAMREKVLRAAGYNAGPVWHSTQSMFDVWDMVRSGGLAFFAKDPDYTRAYVAGVPFSKRRAVEAYLKTGIEFDARSMGSGRITRKEFIDFLAENGVELGENTRETIHGRFSANDKTAFWGFLRALSEGGLIYDLESAGYTAVRQMETHPMSKDVAAEVVAVFSPNQIKTAEPLNIGPDGKLIPPSQWGDPESDSILYASAPEIETIINRLHQARREAETSWDFIRTFSQSHLTDLSNPGMHNVGRAIPPFKDEPYTDIEEILENNKNYLETIRHEEPAVYREITKPGDTVTVYRAVPSSLAMEGIRIGDYVSLERRYAEMHAESVLGAQQGIDGEVIKLNVPKRDVVWGEVAFSEWAYSPRELRDQIKSLEEFYENPTSASSEGGTRQINASAPEATRPLPGDMPWDRAAKSAVGAIAKAAKHTPGYNALAVGLAEFYGDSKLTKPIRGTINYLRGQFVPDGLMPREARALLHEMRIKQVVGAEKALDVWRAATGKTVKFSDLAFPAAWKGDTDMQRRMFWAMNGKVSMASLPKELQDLAGKLRAMLDEEAREAVRQGRMHPDTYKSMREEGYMPHYYFEHETMAGKMAGIFRRYKLNQGDIKAQRMTAYRIESLNEKDRNGLPAMLNWTDAKTGRKAYRFKGKEHMDAWFENFILEETAKVVSGKKGFGKIGASQLQRLEELPAEQRGYARRVMEETRRKWVKQKPLDAEEQEAVGLITDPVYAITRYVAQMSHDNATAHVFNQVANNPEWATVQDLAGMKQIPDRPGFGKLAGMYVIPEIYDQVTELANIPHTALRVYDKFLTLFKTGKTVWNPGTHGRNVLGNTMFSMLAGTTVWSNPQYYARAHKTIVKGGADLQEMYDEGVLGADFIQGELKENMLSLLPDTALIGDGESVSRFSEAWLKADKGRKKIADKVNALYTYEDAIYKAAAYLKARDKGFTPKQAADHVRMWFPFYDQVGSSALVKGLKRGPMPFFSFFRESTRILGNGVRHRPISLMAMMALPEMVSWISAAALGLTDDDEEQIRKDMRGKGKFMFRDTPIFAMLMPFTDSQGRPVQWDLSNIIPFADLLGKKLDYGKKKPFWAELADKMMASPALGVMAAAMGKDTFRDRDLYHEDESTTAKAVKTAKEIYRKLAPPLLPGGTSWDTIAASAERSTNKTLERRSMPMATARALAGLDFRNANPDWYRQQEDVRRDMGKKDGSYTMGASAPATAERKKLWGLLVQAIDGKDDMDEIVQTLNNLTEYGWDIRENKLSTILAPRNPTPRDEAEAATNDRLMRRKGPLSFAQHMRIKREYKQIVDKAGPIIDRATRLMEPPKPRLLTTTN